jgi:hypothetical protein
MAEFWKVAGLMNGETFYAAAAVGLVALDGGRKLDAWRDHQESVTKINELYAKESAFSEKEFKEKKLGIIMNHINREIEDAIDSFSASKIGEYLSKKNDDERKVIFSRLLDYDAIEELESRVPRLDRDILESFKSVINGDNDQGLVQQLILTKKTDIFAPLHADVFDGVVKDKKVAKDKAALEFLESKVENFLPLSKEYIPFQAKEEYGNDSEIAKIRSENNKGVSDKVDYLKSAWRNKAKKKFEGHPSQRNSPEEFQELRTFSQARL